MQSLFGIVDLVLELYIWCLIIYVVMSWLIAFNVINTYNRFVSMVVNFLYQITEPPLRPIRRVLPNVGGIDLSPLALVLIIILIRSLLREYGLIGSYRVG
ncbi:MAG: YggT family protein [Alphaproteobacteria bacterium]|nr:YggT family protein [Alphaproteobacteria bacterium]